jgi:hypothetical protein
VTRHLLALGAACLLGSARAARTAPATRRPGLRHPHAGGDEDRRDDFCARAQANGASGGGTLRAHAELVSNSRVTKASKAVTDFWFDACG